ncbi:MAG: hypothetical protein ACOX68_03435 [Candidatus Limivicinus sp.]|jgi:hypothetical protein
MAETGRELQLADGLEALMEERGIRSEDVLQVIEEGESSGNRLFSESSGHSLAKKWLNNFCVYVEYAAKGGVFEVYDTYSHRVQFTDEEQ